MNKLYNTQFIEEEVIFLEKWLGKIVDRGDLLEEVEEDNEGPTAEELYRLFKRLKEGIQ